MNTPILIHVNTDVLTTGLLIHFPVAYVFNNMNNANTNKTNE